MSPAGTLESQAVNPAPPAPTNLLPNTPHLLGDLDFYLLESHPVIRKM